MPRIDAYDAIFGCALEDTGQAAPRCSERQLLQ